MSNTTAIPVLHANLCSVIQAIHAVFQVTLEGNTLILRGKSTVISFDNKLADKSSERFLITTKFYKSTNNNPFSPPKKQMLEGKTGVHPEGESVKKQENTTAKQILTQKINNIDLHVKLDNQGEYRM